MEEKLDLQAFSDFPTASAAVSAFLQAQTSVSLWAVTRRDLNRWVVLRTAGDGYPLVEGTELNWPDTICARMVDGLGPRMALDLEDVPGYSDTPFARMFEIGCYVGIPITRPDGSLFGTLMGIDPRPQQESDLRTDLIRFAGQVLHTVLATDVRAMEDALRMERLRVESLIDPLTGLGNRRYWTHLLAAQESRCRRYGETASIVMVDVSPNGSKDSNEVIMREASEILRNASRAHDVTARLGGNSLAVLAVGADRTGANTVARRVRSAMRSKGWHTVMGVGHRESALGLEGAWENADTSLRKAKSKR
jgi:diguanylate cyclase